MKLSINQITFLIHVPSDIKVDMTSGWRHHYFKDFSKGEISSFIESIKDEKIYLLIPLLAASQSFRIATLNLSEPFLVNNKSNPDLITEFIWNQWNSSGFSMKEGTPNAFSFKFKRVWFDYK
jgi:hypothetical protein